MARIHQATVKVMGGGRITIPSGIREVENIEEGSYLKISIEKIEQSKDGNKRAHIPQKRYQKDSRNQQGVLDG